VKLASEGIDAPFSVATYNVLANAYAMRAWYPRTPSMVLDPAWRIPALARYVSELQADLLCLQEVEPDLFGTLRASLGSAGYESYYARKGAGRPDGAAIFYRRQKFALISAGRLLYADAADRERDSGYLALIALFRAGERLLGVINTHLVWDPPGGALETQQGYRQACHLLTEYQRIEHTAAAWILAGDLNVVSESALAAMIRGAGFEQAHSAKGSATCNVGGEARMIDYLFHTSALRAEPQPIVSIDHQTVLPSANHPSDHVPVSARFTWNA
jgi:mRNA deadenylase 3'-5' endonuclease subunit Ccr4